ncbi:TolC family protein [uncultured Alcanivorax sp.]|uniref:TolC family protein n=1 Tax=uncultured Alcanivorax sp. TaxID=191215 RepID=UPI0026083C0C|nr:TolC family protein [uncultured Alcanivorax sp.]
MESLSAVVRRCALLLLLCATGAQAETAPGQWAGWLQQQINNLPASRAINAEQERWLAENRDAAQPLYNPELNIGYEDSADTTRTVGLSQTLDWSGKARANRDAVAVRDSLAQLRADKARASLVADSLNALVAFDAARARLAATRQQEQQLSALSDLIRRREQAGDLGQVDAQLAWLSLAETQQTMAQAESDATAAATRLRQVLASAQPGQPLPAARHWQAVAVSTDASQRLPASFDLRLAQQQLALAEQDATVAGRQRRADPTLGVSVGKEGDDNLWGVDISLPLKLFNTGKERYQAALADSDARRALLEKTRADIAARLDGALRDYQQRRERWQTWQQLTGDTLSRSDALLQRVWQQGELTTQNYLQALNQRLDTRLSGIALREAMQQAWVRWLRESAQLNDWLNQLAN